MLIKAQGCPAIGYSLVTSCFAHRLDGILIAVQELLVGLWVLDISLSGGYLHAPIPDLAANLAHYTC